MTITSLFPELVLLLKRLIETPSFSGEESETASILQEFLSEKGCGSHRLLNNIWSVSSKFDPSKPNLLLNSHHDTVKPNTSYTNNPFSAEISNGKLFGLGSNDAGGPLVALLGAYLLLEDRDDLPFNLIFAATAEEEISGANGVEALLKVLPKIDFGIVGEPTSMHLAIAEKGLLVVDAYAEGTPGHAAHVDSFSAIYTAAKDIQCIQHYEFPKISATLGKVKATVTQIDAGKQHNVVPGICHYVIDVRVTDVYSNQEVFELLNNLTESRLEARSFRLNSSAISDNHPVVLVAQKLGLATFGSPTISDQSLMDFPTVKIGPGSTLRSHTADEFIFLDEMEAGLSTYVQLITSLAL